MGTVDRQSSKRDLTYVSPLYPSCVLGWYATILLRGGTINAYSMRRCGVAYPHRIMREIRKDPWIRASGKVYSFIADGADGLGCTFWQLYPPV
jgi:hypothetical protein